MFTYIQIIDKDSNAVKAYVDYEIKNGILMMTLIRGAKTLHRINIPIAEITDFKISNFYGNDRIDFIYHSKLYTFINTGYGESRYLENRLVKMIDA